MPTKQRFLFHFGVLLQQKCSVEVVFSLLPNSFLDMPCKGLGGAYITSRQAYPNKNRALEGPVLIPQLISYFPGFGLGV